jgi:hypothetical protein
MSTNIQQVKQFAVYVDKAKNGGNANGYVDGNEIELFKKKCKTAGIKNVDEIMDNYSKNRVLAESEYEANGTKSNSSIETAVISALTENTALKDNEKNTASATTIKGLFNKHADGFWSSIVAWWNDDKELVEHSNLINEKNVLEVVSDDEVLDKVTSADADEAQEQIANNILSALVKAAESKNIDVSNLIMQEDGKWVVGRDVEDTEIMSDATTDKNFIAVVKALRTAIADGEKNTAGNGDDKVGMLTVLAKKIDSEEFGGNGNGYIDAANEIEQFKNVAAKKGYDINAILTEIRDNEANGVENTTELQKTVFNIFDPYQTAAREKYEAGQAANVAEMFKDGVNEDNEELLTKAAEKIDSDNVMEVLNSNPELVDKLVEEYDRYWFNIFQDDTYQNYTTPILTALIARANEYGIAIDDIVMQNGDKYIVGGGVSGAEVGEDATDSDNVSKVIKAIQTRLNEQA